MEKGDLSWVEQLLGDAVRRLDGVVSRLDRVIELLEQPHAVKEKGEKKKTTPNPGIGRLIKAYVDAWQARYKTKGRPEVTKAIGIFRSLLTERSEEELIELVQVFCQMQDPWFVTKRHDIATFRENIGKIVLARDKGFESTDVNWKTVFGDEDGAKKIRAGNGPLEENIRREELPRGEAGCLLEGFSEPE